MDLKKRGWKKTIAPRKGDSVVKTDLDTYGKKTSKKDEKIQRQVLKNERGTPDIPALREHFRRQMIKLRNRF